jgi:hypothetical protein
MRFLSTVVVALAGMALAVPHGNFGEIDCSHTIPSFQLIYEC